MEYTPLNMFNKSTDELRQLITEHPDYPIVVEVDSEIVADDGYNSWIAPNVHYYIGEILDCCQTINDERIFMDRDDFWEEVSYRIFECDNDFETKYGDISTEEYDRLVDEYVAQYDQYWKNVIVIRATT